MGAGSKYQKNRYTRRIPFDILHKIRSELHKIKSVLNELDHNSDKKGVRLPILTNKIFDHAFSKILIDVI